MRVLVAEDDSFTRAGLVEILQAEGHEVIEASDGDAAIQRFRRDAPDFVCLDIMMPKRSGYEVCRTMRAGRPDVPIVFISAKSEEIDKVLGLDLGADDFIVKPFGVKEVVARVRAVARRCGALDKLGVGGSPFQMGDLEVFPAELRARRDGRTIELSLRDVKILRLLFLHRGQVLDRNTIFNRCWGEDYFPNSRTLDQHISQLRKRIEVDPKSPVLIRTVHGAGYRFE